MDGLLIVAGDDDAELAAEACQSRTVKEHTAYLDPSVCRIAAYSSPIGCVGPKFYLL